MEEQKNSLKSRVIPFESHELDTEMLILRVQASADAESSFGLEVEPRRIGILFVLEQSAALLVPGSGYTLALEQGTMYILYNPQNAIKAQVSLSDKTRMLVMMIGIEHMHELFMGGKQNAELFDAISVDKRYHTSAPIATAMYGVLEQMFFARMPENAKTMYMRAKVLEAMSLYFGANQDVDLTGCPFLNDEATVKKVHMAKELVMKDMANAPTIKELCQKVGLNEYQLKVGFKRLYGSPVYQYYNEHRLNHAKTLLSSGRFKVNEVAWDIGYTNTSHFIAAFKRKFGITPKKFLMSLENMVSGITEENIHKETSTGSRRGKESW
jgi:AraC family transcriptional regulator, transcriptional activator of the genes for pyochelin and ferripyochelin receptors